jgi:ORF6N domain
MKASPVPVHGVEHRIVQLRGHRVIIDADLADLYAVQTRVLNQAVKRNPERFPDDFMFQLSPKEFENWRSQIVISNSAAKMGLRRSPYAFTEHGALMAAAVLNSPRAVEMSLYVVRAFVRMRQVLAAHKDLATRLEQLEGRVERGLATHDQAIAGLIDAVRQLMTSPEPTKKRRIGFVQD